MHEIISICKGGGCLYCRTKPLHPKANTKGLYPLHRVLVENHLKRYLLLGEDVHHLDEDKNNNLIDNLTVLTKAEHARHHHQEKALMNIICPSCGSEFNEKPHIFKLRQKRNKSGNVFCSKKCGGSVR